MEVTGKAFRKLSFSYFLFFTGSDHFTVRTNNKTGEKNERRKLENHRHYPHIPYWSRKIYFFQLSLYSRVALVIIFKASSSLSYDRKRMSWELYRVLNWKIRFSFHSNPHKCSQPWGAYECVANGSYQHNYCQIWPPQKIDGKLSLKIFRNTNTKLNDHWNVQNFEILNLIVNVC